MARGSPKNKAGVYSPISIKKLQKLAKNVKARAKVLANLEAQYNALAEQKRAPREPKLVDVKESIIAPFAQAS